MPLFEFKKNKLWVWKAYCRASGQLIDWECGDRDRKTLKRLLNRLKRWNIWFYFTNHWQAYAEGIDVNDLFQGKSGTVAIERNNGRQRHWFARFRRKSIVISKSLHMVEMTMALFVRFHVNGNTEDINHSLFNTLKTYNYLGIDNCKSLSTIHPTEAQG